MTEVEMMKDIIRAAGGNPDNLPDNLKTTLLKGIADAVSGGGSGGGVVARLDVVGDSLTLENGAFAKLQNAIINCQHASVYGFQEQDGMLGVYVFDIHFCVQGQGIVIYSKPFFDDEFTITPDNTIHEGNLFA